MTGQPRPSPLDAERATLPAAGEPHDSCFRCGRPTPLGVSLCADDNPGRVRSPSATQVHGTIAVGILVGFLIFALAARLAVGGDDEFSARVLAASGEADGSAQLTMEVRNAGDRDAVADCRIQRRGLPAPDDPVFRTELLRPGATQQLSQLVRPAAGSERLDLERIQVRCT